MQLKNFTIALSCMVLAFLFSNNAFAQNFGIVVGAPTVDCSGGTPTVTFTLSATSTSAYLVDNWNAFLYFNQNAITNPQITFAPGFTGNYGNGVDVLVGITQFNAFWNGAANGQTQSFSTTPTLLVTVTFDIVNNALPTGLLFEIAQTFGTDNSFNEYYLADGSLFGGITLACPAGPCSINSLVAGAQSACVPASNTYTQVVTVNYSNPPAGGNLIVNGQSFPVTSSPQAVILTGLTANGNAVNVTASFSAEPGCTLTTNSLFTAPASCAPVCNISGITAGTQTACVPASNTYTQQVTVTYSNQPASGQLTVNGQNFAITSSPQTVTLTGLTANGNSVSVTASFTADPGCTLTANDLFTAPASCAPVCNISSITAGTQTACDPATNTYTQQVTITFSNPPPVGNLVVSGQSFTIGTSPRTVTITGLAADGNPVNVTASFSVNPGCALTVNGLFTAPANCTPVCNITGLSAGVQTACVPATNTYTQQVTVLYVNPPASGQLTVNGQNFAITGSPQTVTLTGLNANGAGVNVTASFTANPSCSLTNTNVFVAPESCAIVDPCLGVIVNGTATYNCTTNLQLSATGGSGSYTFTANGNPVNNGDALANGTYTIVATDSNGCSDSTPFTLVVNSLTALSVSYSCVNGLTFNTTGGVGPFLFTADGTPVTNGSFLVDGTYTINGSDSNGCVATTTLTVGCDLCTGVVIDVDASYDCDLGLDVLVNGGTCGGCSFNITANGIAVTSGSFLPNGTYTIVATDVNGCTGTQSGLVVDCISTGCTGVDIEVTATYNCATGLVVSATGGDGEYTFNLESGAVLANGSYTIVATDENGCTGSVGLDVDCISCVGVSIDVTASYDCNSGLSVSASGGTGSFTFMTNGFSVGNGSFLPDGAYIITAFDDNGCAGSATVTVSSIHLTVSYNCLTGLSISASGGTGSYSFSTIQGAGVTNGTVLANGFYQFNAVDGNGCSGNIAGLTVNCGGTGGPCDGVDFLVAATYDCENGLSFTSIGNGTSPYTIIADGTTPVTDGSFLADGTHTFSVTDANGCSGSFPGTVTVDCGITPGPCDGVTISVSASYSCATGLSVSASGGTGPYSFGPLNGTFLPEGVYIISATDANGCSGTTVLTVGNCNQAPVANPDAIVALEGTATVTINVLPNDSDPDGDPISLVSIDGVSPSGAGSVTNFTAGGQVTFAITPGFTGNVVISYTIQDSNGASASSTITVTVQSCDANAGILNNSFNLSCADSLGLGGFDIAASGFNNSAGYSQSYFIVDGAGNILAISASGDLTNIPSGTYSVYAVNYADASAPTFGVGTNIADLLAQSGDTCFDVSTPAEAVVLTQVTLDWETFCDPTVDGGFFVRLIANGGFPAYANVGGYGTNLPPYFIPWDPILGAGVLVSGPFPNGLPCFKVDIVSDGFLCTVGDILVCPPEPCVIECTPEAGDMSDELQPVCDGASASVLSVGIEIDVEEVGFYVVHTAPDLGDGDVLAVFAVPFNVTDAVSIALADVPGATTNTVYYVSAIVGQNDFDGDGLPDLGDICTDVSDSTPIVFLNPLLVDIQPICNDDTQEYTLVIAVSGSYPEFDPSALYTVFGDFNGQISESVLVAGYASGSEYFIGVTDDAGCSYTENNLVTCKPTPITLLTFDGKVLAEGNMLNWTTATETDNDFFTLKRSVDGVNFNAIGTVKGVGNSIIANSYEFLDKNAPNGLSYYVLEQTDFDGTTTIASEVITLRRDAAPFGFVDVAPIPTANTLTVSYNTSLGGEVKFVIHDVAGRLISSHIVLAQNGLNNVSFDVSNYSAGVYFITINNGLNVQTTRFVKE